MAVDKNRLVLSDKANPERVVFLILGLSADGTQVFKDSIGREAAFGKNDDGSSDGSLNVTLTKNDGTKINVGRIFNNGTSMGGEVSGIAESTDKDGKVNINTTTGKPFHNIVPGSAGSEDVAVWGKLTYAKDAKGDLTAEAAEVKAQIDGFLTVYEKKAKAPKP